MTSELSGMFVATRNQYSSKDNEVDLMLNGILRHYCPIGDDIYRSLQINKGWWQIDVQNGLILEPSSHKSLKDTGEVCTWIIRT